MTKSAGEVENSLPSQTYSGSFVFNDIEAQFIDYVIQVAQNEWLESK